MEKSWFAKLHFPWEKTELCIYLHDNWFCFPYLGDLFTLICILLSVRVAPSSGFITSIINCKLLSYLVVNLVDYTKSSFLFSDYDNGQRYIYKVNKKHFPIFFKEPILYIIVWFCDTPKGLLLKNEDFVDILMYAESIGIITAL